MDKNAFIRLLFERAKAAGFADCEVYLSAGDDFEVNIFKGEIIEYSSASSEGLGFRGLYNGKMGVSSTQVYDEESADQLIEGAIEAAKLIENEDEQFLYAGDAEYPKLELYNEALDSVSAAEKIELAKALEKATYEKDERVKQTEACEAVSMSNASRIVNTRGLDVQSRVNGVAAYVVPVVQEGDKPSIGMKFAMTTDFQALAAKTEALASESVSEAIDFLNAQSVPSGEYPCVIRADAAADLLRTFSGVFNAENAQKGLSLLKGKEGTVIASAAVTIADDPFRAGSVSSKAFDGEGVATKKKNVVESGTLTTLLHNLKTAKKQGVETTANAYRGGYSSSVGIAPSNFYIVPGESSREGLLAQMEDGLLITDLQGLHSGADGISGDFSLSAKGYKIENGKPAHAVEQITVAGNFFKLLESVIAVGSDLEFSLPGGPSFGSPSILINKIAVAGK